jgi:hypothetical protein
MIEAFSTISWGSFFPLIMVLFLVVLPVKGTFNQLKGHFPRGDGVLLMALVIKTLLPFVAIGVAVAAFLISTQISVALLAWATGLTGLVISASLFGLLYFGPLYPLFDALSEAQIHAERRAATAVSSRGN